MIKGRNISQRSGHSLVYLSFLQGAEEGDIKGSMIRKLQKNSSSLQDSETNLFFQTPLVPTKPLRVFQMKFFTRSICGRMLCPEKTDLLGLESGQKTKQCKLSVGATGGTIVVLFGVEYAKRLAWLTSFKHTSVPLK